MTLLPGALRSALERLADGRSRTDLAERSRQITATYQARQNSSQSLHSADDALAYALARMPATYAATLKVLGQLIEATPGFAPRSLLDVGCGPGTASFAALRAFPGLEQITLLDRNGPFLDLARILAETGYIDREASFIDHDITRDVGLPSADLVIAGYVLAELDGAAQIRLIDELWGAAQHALVLVEPGTPDGFRRLKAARIALINHGAHVAAPCTHEAACPMTGEAWCRFFARVQRSRDHRLLKDAERPFEDEPYAYLVLTRRKPEERMSHRIVARPVVTKIGSTLGVCGADGLHQASAPSRQKELFKRYKRLDWGDAVEILIQETLVEGKARRECPPNS
jgi:ribosomal protein RSM22 (predicted rRNA methylase)